MEVVASIPRRAGALHAGGRRLGGAADGGGPRAPPGTLRDGVWAWQRRLVDGDRRSHRCRAEREASRGDWRSAVRASSRRARTTTSKSTANSGRRRTRHRPRGGSGSAAHVDVDADGAMGVESRGFAYRACRDRSRPLVDLGSLPPPDAAADLELGGSLRERRDRARRPLLARRRARDAARRRRQVAVLPLHERLAHGGGEDGGNVRLVAGDPRDAAGGDADGSTERRRARSRSWRAAHARLHARAAHRIAAAAATATPRPG